MKNLEPQYMFFGVLLLLAVVIAFAPVDEMAAKKPDAGGLIHQINERSNYIQAEELAHWIIDKDPGFQIVDLRSADDYEKYHIPGNIHIPFKKLLDSESDELLDNEKYIVLASNGNTIAAQAWLLLKETGYRDVLILEGGLNHWVNVFSNPQEPQEAFSNDEVFTYQFRKAAGPVMMGTKVAAADEAGGSADKHKPVVRKRKKMKKKVDEGC